MTDYATAAEVQSEFSKIDFSASGAKVTTTEVERFISEESAYVDAHLYPLYTLPIDAGATTTLAILKRITIALVAYRVADIIRTPISVGDGKFKQDARGVTAYKQARKDLEDIKAEKLILPDADQKESRDPVSYNDSNDVDYVFDTESQQW